MAIAIKSDGMRRYFSEYVFHQSVEKAQRDSGTEMTVSGAKQLRKELAFRLRDRGFTSLDDPQRSLGEYLSTVDETLSARVEGYTSQYERGFSSEAAQGQWSRFNALVQDADQGLLPVSPYDPDWAGRATVMRSAPALLYITEHELNQYAGGTPRGAKQASEEMALHTREDFGYGPKLREVGPARTTEDRLGLSRLGPYMTREELETAQDVLGKTMPNAGGRGGPPSTAGLTKAEEILRTMRDEGVEFDIRGNGRPGQLVAAIEGTAMQVRITDTAENEQHIGKVYDDGIATRFETNQSRGLYDPTPQEAVKLLAAAQGRQPEGAGPMAKKKRVPHLKMELENPQGRVRLPDGSYTGVEGEINIVRAPVRERSMTTMFPSTDTQKAENHLRSAVDTARENFETKLGGERLIEEASSEAAAEEGYTPEFSGDPEIAAIQRQYWGVLTDSENAGALLRPGVTEDDYRARLGEINDMGLDSAERDEAHRQLLAETSFEAGEPADAVRAHAMASVDELVGTYETHRSYDRENDEYVDKRFNPVRVAEHMTSENGYWGDRAELISAMRAADIEADELLGEGFHAQTIRDALVKFDTDSAKSIAEVEDPLQRHMMQTVADTAARSSAQLNSVQIDDNGIIRYEGVRLGDDGQPSTDERAAFSGEIGQVFERGDHGEVVTNFHASENYMFVSGYRARVLPQAAGESKSFEERTRLAGYGHQMQQAIEHQVSKDMVAEANRSEIGSATSINSLYGRLYDTRHEVDYIERAAEHGLSQEQLSAILATEGKRVRYSNELTQGSTLHAEWTAQNKDAEHSVLNDNFADPYVLTGGRNLVRMDERSDGFYDPVMTSSGTLQGSVRFLTEESRVMADGSIAPGSEDDAAPLRKLPEFETTEFDPWDRQQMTAAAMTNSSKVTEPTPAAMATFGGWNFEDGVIVSEEFASEHQLPGADGQMRDLTVGDKVTDFHGNKGVISLVVDRNMDPAEAEEQDLGEAVHFFAENPDLQVVQSPFSGVSRLNGGSAREMMQDASPLVNEAGEVPGGMGRMRFMITHKDVESGTRIYDDPGEGRKASAQLGWAMGAKEADAVMAELYGSNDSASADFREYLLATGLDLQADGTLTDEQDLSGRYVFEMPELALNRQKKDGELGAVKKGPMNEAFAQGLGERGGMMELPFPLKMPTGEMTPAMDEQSGSYGLPVLSEHLRSGQDLNDGVVSTHDYTNHYRRIFEQANEFRRAQQGLDSEAAAADPELAERYRKQISDAKFKAQGAHERITDDVVSRRLSGENKHNIFREKLMGARQPNSATAVWSADPRLELGQLGMNSQMAESLGVQEGGGVLTWRDPVLRDSGVRYMEVAVDDRLTGVSVNPASVKSYDGDFDGDSIGVVALSDPEAQKQAYEKFSVAMNLVDEGSQPDVDGMQELSIHTNLDLQVAADRDESVVAGFEQVKADANYDLQAHKSGEISQEEFIEQSQALESSLSEQIRSGFSSQYGTIALDFESEESLIRSMEDYIDAGAKGSKSKLGDFASYAGISYQPETGEVTGMDENTHHTREQEQKSMYATGMKAFATGLGGAYSQRAVRGLRNEALKPALELTYPVTQSVLQAKHDAAEAAQKYDALMSNARTLWRGEALSPPTQDGGYTAKSDPDGKPVKLTAEEWKAQMADFYQNKEHGLGVKINPEHLDPVAKGLSDKKGMMISVEDVDALEAAGKQIAPMDRAAYGGTFSELCEAAEQKQNIFAGEKSSSFAPASVQAVAEHQVSPEFEQLAAQAGIEIETPEPLAPKDVAADFEPKTRSANAVMVKPRVRTGPPEYLTREEPEPAGAGPETSQPGW